MDADGPAVGKAPEAEAPSFEDVITGAVQEALDAEEDPEDGRHIVTDWVLVAEVIGPNGRTFDHVRYSSDEMMFSRALGMIKYGEIQVEKDLKEEDD